ncbi:hypothetical protein D3C76_1829660 [compost metagenome]
MALKCSHRQSSTVTQDPGGRYSVLAWLWAAENDEVDIHRLLRLMQTSIIQQQLEPT